METFEARQIRCPRLGGEVTFAYCRQEGGDLPCHRIAACWQGILPVESLLKPGPGTDGREGRSGSAPADRLSLVLAAAHRAKGGKAP